MNQTESVLPSAIPFFSLLELLLALLVSLLDYRSRSTRYLAGLLVLLAINSGALIQLDAAADVDQAEPWLYVLSVTTLAMGPALFTTTLSLLRPAVWDQKAWERWLWRCCHVLVVLPLILILSDVLLDTRWLYTGLDPQAYAGGFTAARNYLQGSWGSFFILFSQVVINSATLLPIIHALWRDRQATPLIRQRARWLLAAQLLIVAIQLGLRSWLDTLPSIICSEVILFSTYAIFLARGMLSDRTLRRWLADVPLRPKLYMGLGVSLVGLLVIGGTSVYAGLTTRRLTTRTLTRQRQLADLAYDINDSMLFIQIRDAEFYDEWVRTGFEGDEFEQARQEYVIPLQQELQQIRDDIDSAKQLELNPETVTSLDQILDAVNAYEPSLLAVSDSMEGLGNSTSGEFGQLYALADELTDRLTGSGLEALQITLLQIAQQESIFFQRADLSAIGRARQLIEQLRQQIAASDDTQLASTDKAALNALLDSYDDHLLAAANQQSILQQSRANMIRQSNAISEWVRRLSNEQRAALEDTITRLESQQFNTTMTTILLALITIITSIAIAYLIAERITRPVQVLGETANRLGAGELSVRATVLGRDEIGTTAAALNLMADRLQETLSGLEQQVAERVRELERRSTYLQASAEVSRAAASILEADQLIYQVAELIREQFNLYYVGLFQVDERGEWAVLRAGTGEAGRAMLARGHRIQIGKGMIGWSIANAQPRVALEAGRDAVRLATTELPHTRSEAALPLRSRDQVLGALTVQSDQPEAFDQDTIAVLQSMADQVAVALDNARLFTASQAALEAARRAYGELGREAWADLLRARPDLGFRSDELQITHAEAAAWRPEMEQALQQGQTILGDGDRVPLAVPIKVGDQIIGVLDTYKAAATGSWTQQEVALLEEITGQLGLALESARLYEDTQRRAARERLTGEVTARMRETLDIEDVLATAVDEIYRALGLDELTIYLSPEAQYSIRK